MLKKLANSFIISCLLFFLVINREEACHSTFPDGDISSGIVDNLVPELIDLVTDDETTLGPGETTFVTTIPTTTPSPCIVQAVPFGTLSPAAGSTIADGTVVTLTCNPSYHASRKPATQVCRDGIISPNLKCIINTCDDYMPLLYPGDTPVSQYPPWASTPPVPVPAPIGTSVIIICDPGLGNAIIVRFTNPNVQTCQNANNGPGFVNEMVSLTCDLTGLWKVDMVYGPMVSNIPYNGFVTAPSSIFCNRTPLSPPVCLNPVVLQPYG